MNVWKKLQASVSVKKKSKVGGLILGYVFAQKVEFLL